MCHFKALCAVKYDGGYERPKEGRERKRDGERVRGSWCGAPFDVLADSQLNVELTEG